MFDPQRATLITASGQTRQNRATMREWLLVAIASTNSKDYLAKIGSAGGKQSRRTLTPEQARAMVRAREKKRRKTKRVEQ